ncbi:tRNA-binding protein [Salinispira pacifica]|uniref:Protein secretion chaperonin CsaA n=1 Tax=Salinispira pacifica TaxID=1307761 RepID=V5WGR0_9SPIO|nr:tRNA-binding protein [Salinispira pacifica]AHC14978.1 Protein secretion chaperonin CsaA [Salinispira pacifica]
MNAFIGWDDFEKVDIRVGTIVDAQIFQEARVPAYILRIDLGDDLGILKSSARLTDLYSLESLIGRQVLAVVNFHPKQIGPIQSQCSVLGFYDAHQRVVLAVSDTVSGREIHNGARLL